MQARNPSNAAGCDVSHYQGQIDWMQVAASGIKFAICKCTEGTQYTDDSFTANLTGSKAAGLMTGAYHFFRASTPQEAQQEADFFLSVLNSVGGIDALDIPPILDAETANGVDAATLAACVNAWMQQVEAKTKVKPLIYSYPGFIDNHLQDASLGQYPLHYAYYSDDAPEDRGPWKEWAIMQTTDNGTVPGINSPVDLDIMSGGADMFLVKMDETIAKELIEILSAHYMLAAKMGAQQAVLDKYHQLANEIRRCSGLPADS